MSHSLSISTTRQVASKKSQQLGNGCHGTSHDASMLDYYRSDPGAGVMLHVMLHVLDSVQNLNFCPAYIFGDAD